METKMSTKTETTATYISACFGVRYELVEVLEFVGAENEGVRGIWQRPNGETFEETYYAHRIEVESKPAAMNVSAYGLGYKMTEALEYAGDEVFAVWEADNGHRHEMWAYTDRIRLG